MLSAEYRALGAEIQKTLEAIRIDDQSPVIQWAKVKEEDNYYPDIIFELDPSFSVGRSLFCPILEKNPRHKIISGGHKKEGVFFAYNCEDLAASVQGISDISQGILDFVLAERERHGEPLPVS